LEIFLTQIGPTLPLKTDPPVICFGKWIGWKDYEVPKNRNLESVSAKKLFFSHRSAVLPARVPNCGPTPRIASRFQSCVSPTASLGKTALLTGKAEEGYAGGGRPPARQTTVTVGRWRREERGVRGINSPPHHGQGRRVGLRPRRRLFATRSHMAGPWEWELAGVGARVLLADAGERRPQSVAAANEVGVPQERVGPAQVTVALGFPHHLR
jgi:hypothetical protein